MPLLLRNMAATTVAVSQLGDRERDAEPGRRISAAPLLGPGETIEISLDEASLFRGSSIFRVDVHNDGTIEKKVFSVEVSK